MADKPVFIDSDANAIATEFIQDYQNRTGRNLQDGQVERLLIDSMAYMLSVHKSQINEGLNQNLVAFATFPVLDRLGDIVGVKRLQASNALTTIEFQLVDGHGDVVIPQGTRISTTDGTVVFETGESLTVLTGVNVAEVGANAQDTGTKGNGYVPGTVTEILDPLAFVSTATNVSTTVGGADEETDDQLRERITLAPASFSNAGSRGAYEFWSKTASQLIVDVSVINPSPGIVAVYPLIQGGGATPQEILDLVAQTLNDEKIRPLTDTVNVISPLTVFYGIEVDLTLYTDADQDTVFNSVQSMLNEFVEENANLIGRDIMISQIIAKCTGVDGVYDVDVVSPVADIIITDVQNGVNTGVVVNVTGTNDG